MQAFRIGAFDIAGVSRHMNNFSDRFSASIRNIASGQREMDPVDISMSTRLRSSLDEIGKNIQKLRDGMGQMQQARSEALLKVDVTQRIRELAIAYGNGTLSESEKNDIQTQVDELSKLLSDDRNKLSITYQTTMRVDTEENLIGMDVDVVSKQSSEDASFVIYDTAEIDIGELSLEDLMSSNDSFMQSLTLESEESGTYVYQPSVSTRVLIEEREIQMFDLSAEGALARIDKKLESYAGTAASLTGSLNAAEYELDAMLDRQANMSSRLNDMLATDLAEETAAMMKAKVMMGIGAEVLKTQQNIERETLFALLSSM